MNRATNEAFTRLTPLRVAGNAAVHEAGVHAVREAFRQHDAGGRLTDDELAWLTILLVRLSVRDFAIELTQPHERHVTLWVDVTRRAEHSLVPAPATLLALTAWRCGNGALAAAAAEHALRVEPKYELASLILEALHAGLPPSTFEQAQSGD